MRSAPITRTRVGVNTLIQKIDDARQLSGRLLIFLCTNRYTALDPAILRRAALIDEFKRPDEQERRELFTATLAGVDITPQMLDKLAEITGPQTTAARASRSPTSRRGSCQLRSRVPIPNAR